MANRALGRALGRSLGRAVGAGLAGGSSASVLLGDDFSGSGALTGETPNVNQGANWNNWNAVASGNEGSGVYHSGSAYKWNGSAIGQTDCSIWVKDARIGSVSDSGMLRAGVQNDNYSAYSDGLYVQMEGAATGVKLAIYEMDATTATLKATSAIFGSTPATTLDFFVTIKDDGTGKKIVTGYDSSRNSVVTWTQTAVNAASSVDQGMILARNSSSTSNIGSIVWFDDGDIDNMPTEFPAL